MRNLTGDEVNIIFGAMYDSSMTDTCNVTIIATGIEEKAARQGGLGFKSGYITPTSLQGKSQMGTGAGLGAFSNMGLKQPIGSQTGAQARQQPGLKPIGGIQKTHDIKSSVEEKSLDIPSFLRK